MTGLAAGMASGFPVYEAAEAPDMSVLRNFAKKVVVATGLFPVVRALRRQLVWMNWERRSRGAGLSSLLLGVLRSHFITGSGDDVLGRADLFLKTCCAAKIQYQGGGFLYSPDFHLIALSNRTDPGTISFGNLPIDCSALLFTGLAEIRGEIDSLKRSGNDLDVQKTVRAFETVCDALEIYRDRCRSAILKYVRTHSDTSDNPAEVLSYLEGAFEAPRHRFGAALQMILLVNSLFWTSGMMLVGLGRLDQVLTPFYEEDLSRGILTVERALEMIREFLRLLHRDFYAKSNVMPGDTGQVITLAGQDSHGRDTSNSLTFLFLQAVAALNLPDPKLVLRVHDNTPETLWKAAITCMCSGNGSPLLSNDRQVVPALEAFGYTREDAVLYATSACWEPCLPGLSSDQNNVATINFMKPLQELIDRLDPSSSIQNFPEFEKLYLDGLRSHAASLGRKLVQCDFQPNPFLSLLTYDCVSRGQDVSVGGARYFNLGLTGVAFGNAINALLNIKRLVYDESSIPLLRLRDLLHSDFTGEDVLVADLIARGEKFCTDSPAALTLANEIIQAVADALKGLRTKHGGKLRFGISSPSHIMSRDFPASLDGRRAGTPFGVNISPVLGGPPVSYVESASFASQLDYREAFNGGVFDMVIDAEQVRTNQPQFKSFFQTCFAMGVFQSQVNMVDVDILKDAKIHPERYPCLIVRVWGFSAYFRDLPGEYQDLIIQRAEEARASGF